MESKGDPILDLQSLCKEKPRTKAELQTEYKALGWGVPFETVLVHANGNYIEERDGLYHSRDGSVEKTIRDVLSGAKP